MSLVIQGISASDPLQAVIQRKLHAILRRTRVNPTASSVTFTDVNGPKGGVDIRCAVSVNTPRRPTYHASARGAEPPLAFEGALEALEHELQRDRAKRRDLARRPKKYFVAEQGTQPDGEAALPAVRRRRRKAS